jgi:hypothetical protein
MSDLPQWALDRADAFCEYIFTNGSGQKAERLVLSMGPHDLGGWGRGPLRDRLAALLVEVSEERCAAVAADAAAVYGGGTSGGLGKAAEPGSARVIASSPDWRPCRPPSPRRDATPPRCSRTA